MTEAEIDATILNVVEPRWLKVARVIFDAAKKLGLETDEGYSRIAERLEALVNNGSLEAQGDLTRWRHSEVRNANPR